MARRAISAKSIPLCMGHEPRTTRATIPADM
jgi:hypothetical protein